MLATPNIFRSSLEQLSAVCLCVRQVRQINWPATCVAGMQPKVAVAIAYCDQRARGDEQWSIGNGRVDATQDGSRPQGGDYTLQW
eukprot:11164164-Lingulodinium_polyedra.AAC.1